MNIKLLLSQQAKDFFASQRLLLVLAFTLMAAFDAQAQRFAVTSGNWNGPIWASTTGGAAGSAATPTASDDVTINNGIGVTMNIAGGCASLSTVGGGTATINGPNTLSVSSGVTIAHLSTLNLNSNVTAATLNTTATSNYSGTIGGTGVLTLSGRITFADPGTGSSGNTSLTIANKVSTTGVSASYGTGNNRDVTLEIGSSGTIAFSVLSNSINRANLSYVYLADASLEYNSNITATAIEWPASAAPTNVTINGNITPPGGRTIAGVLKLQSGTLTNSSNNITLSNGATIIRSGGTLAAAPNIPSGLINVQYDAPTSPAAITTGPEMPATVNNLTINNPGGVVLNANKAINGLLTVNNGAVLVPGASHVVSGTGTLTGSGTVQVTRNSAVADFLNQYTITNKILVNLTVDYNSTSAQTISAINYGNLRISGSRGANNVTLPNGGTIGIAGTFAPVATFTTGEYTRTGNTVSFNGSGIQTIPAFTFTNLLIANTAGATLTGAVSVANSLTLVGNLTTNSNKFTLLSDVSGTASVSNSPGIVVGNATVERFITANNGLGYRHYSSPVFSTTVADLITTGFTPVVNAAYNTAADPNAVSPFPTVFGYNQDRLTGANWNTQQFDNGWFSPAALTDVLVRGRGYTVNILGTQKVDFVGTLNNGNVTVSGLKREPFLDAGWHLLGNPYPSSIDWGLLTKPAGMDGAVYIWRSSGEYTGTYDSYVNGVGGAQTIAAMQGFFVHVNSSSPINFTFTNAARTSASAPFYRTAADQRPQLQLSLKDADGLADDTYVYFQNEATATVNGEFDAYKVQAFYEDRPTLFANFGESAISIKGLPLTNSSQSVPLEFYVPQSGNYTFSVAKFVNFPAAASVQLLDKKTNQSYDLSQGKEITIALTTTEPHRFVLNFSAVAANPLSAGDLVETGVEAIVYPNPAKGDMNLVLSGHEASPEAVEVVLYNTLGQLVLRNTVSATQAQAGVTLQTSNFAGGIYHLRIKAAGKTITKKVVLSR